MKPGPFLVCLSLSVKPVELWRRLNNPTSLKGVMKAIISMYASLFGNHGDIRVSVQGRRGTNEISLSAHE